MPVPSGARDLLDIGGSHGHYSAALCRMHDGLRGVVLDLPEAVQHAAPLLAAEKMGDRVVHRVGNELTDDLGENSWDFVLISQVVHHFSEQQNRELAQRVARALRPRGVYAVMEAFRSPRPRDAGQLEALLDFNFALTSRSGTWTPAEIADWQRQAGLQPRPAVHLRSVPGTGIQAAVRPST
jgi:2-polyprenyl-3-methyl-5-hydroxy-6-metoxy-1,4-benzoquinol methylase